MMYVSFQSLNEKESLGFLFMFKIYIKQMVSQIGLNKYSCKYWIINIFNLFFLIILIQILQPLLLIIIIIILFLFTIIIINIAIILLRLDF